MVDKDPLITFHPFDSPKVIPHSNRFSGQRMLLSYRLASSFSVQICIRGWTGPHNVWVNWGLRGWQCFEARGGVFRRLRYGCRIAGPSSLCFNFASVSLCAQALNRSFKQYRSAEKSVPDHCGTTFSELVGSVCSLQPSTKHNT
jgi:hypothetical protein